METTDKISLITWYDVQGKVLESEVEILPGSIAENSFNDHGLSQYAILGIDLIQGINE